jgi:hypothetical protein
MKQRWLPEFDCPDVEQPRVEADSTDGGQSGVPESAGVLPGQTELFTAERELIGQIEAALASGRFEDARLYRDALTVIEGASAGLPDLAALDVIGEARFWDRALPAVLSDWLALDQTLKTPPNFGRLMCDGGLSRLTERYAAAEIVAAAPTMLATLTNRICMAAGENGDLPPDATKLVRDALLDGRELVPDAFTDDRIIDVLAEDCRPVWLACMGALRNLWPVPPVDPFALNAITATDEESNDEDERALQFWACLRRTVSYGRDHPEAVASRMRMKRLHPDMHALFMRRGVRRE